jgi:hypothetical protein
VFGQPFEQLGVPPGFDGVIGSHAARPEHA